jgi:hypothetical protein
LFAKNAISYSFKLQVILVQLRQFCDAKVNASSADLAVSAICLSAALAASSSVELALVVQTQLELIEVMSAAKLNNDTNINELKIIPFIINLLKV